MAHPRLAPDPPLENLRIRKGGGGSGLGLTWTASTHHCQGRYRVVEAGSAEPASASGHLAYGPGLVRPPGR